MHPDAIRWTWHVRSERDRALAQLLQREREVEARAGVEILKHNMARTVLALPATRDHPSLIVKRYHPRGHRETLKYLVLPSRADTEWSALLHFERMRVPAPRPVAMGEARWGGLLRGACLVMERLADSVPLNVWLSRPHGDRARARAIEQLGRLVIRMIEAGVDHRDLHAGNILVQRVGHLDRICVIDLHTCRLGAVPPGGRQRRTLAKLLHSLEGVITPGEGQRLVAEVFGDQDGQIYSGLRRQARNLERTRLQSRTRRCLKTTSEFIRETRNGFRFNRRRWFPLATLESLLENHSRLDTVLKERSRQIVGTAQIEIEGRSTVIVVKRRVERGVFDALRFRVGFLNPMLRAWWAGRALEVRRIPTPRTLALVRPALFSRAAVSLLVTEYVEGASTLRDALLDLYYPPPRGDRSVLRHRVGEFARVVRNLHDHGIYHRDLNPQNYLVSHPSDGNGELVFSLIDLESIHSFRRLTPGRRKKNLVQLALLPEGHIQPRDRLRFLYVYDRHEGRFWNREWIRDLDRLLADETVKIIARLSWKERLREGDPEVEDRRFELERPQ